MVKQLGFLINLQKCTGCHGCEFACKNENNLNDFGYRKVVPLKKQKNIFAFLSMACNHCANPQCVRVCPQKCFQKLRNGIILHDPTHCDQCQSCLGACPFSAPKVNPLTQKINKCNLCIDRIKKGQEPACVAACIPNALQIIDITAPLPDNYLETIPYIPSVRLTKPSARFILPKTTKCFWIQ